ncbi:MAG: hypothetical protein LBE12_09630 [Planctomycetaceae bacterium]|jgi:hypothetical protein|nr:hypothetical protein [Planctomycetaceae bacterium]
MAGESPLAKHCLSLNYCFFGGSHKNYMDRLQKEQVDYRIQNTAKETITFGKAQIPNNPFFQILCMKKIGKNK